MIAVVNKAYYFYFKQINMKPNVTSVSFYLPENHHISKFDLSEACYSLRKKGFISLNRKQHSKLIAEEHLALLEKKRLKVIQDKLDYKKISVLYRICIPFKVDCYSACCRFIEWKFCEFIPTPDRLPIAPYKEEQGYWYNHIMKTTGYFKESCGNWCKKTGTCNHQLYIVENLLDEFKQFIKKNYKVLDKYRKSKYVDYSHLAYNGVTNDF